LGTFFLLGVWKIDFEGLQQIYRGKLNHIELKNKLIESLADVLVGRGYKKELGVFWIHNSEK